MRYRPDKHRLPVFESSGILLADKPSGWTSFDVVNMIRNRFNIPKVGHAGTLDPAATGLLVLLLGKFTRLCEKFSADDKVYEATLQLGLETDSQDMDGQVIAESDPSGLSDEEVKKVILSFTGKQLQIPPMVSAVKKDGRKLYELARKGIEVEREPREIEIFDLKVNRCGNPFYDLTIHCSKGTYVRTLCSDIGKKLGCGGVLKSLRRTRCGEFDVSNALSVEQIKSMEQADLEIYLRNFLFDNFKGRF